MVWSELIVCYLFLAGLGAGSFLLACLAGWLKGPTRKIRLIGSLVGFVAVGVGTLLLMVDARAGLGHPARFFGLVTNLASPMAWGVICLTVFLVLCAVSLIVQLRKKAVPKAVDVLGALCSIGVATYTGVLLGYSVSYPLWNIVILPLLFVVSAALAGFSLVSAIAYFVARDELPSLKFMRKADVALPVLVGVLFAALLVATALSPAGAPQEASSATIQSILAGAYAPVFWIGVVACGIVVPLATGIARYASKRDEVTKTSVAGYVATCVGEFAMRYVIVMAAVGMTIGAIF